MDTLQKTDVEILKDYLFDNGIKITWLCFQLNKERAWATKLFYEPDTPLDEKTKSDIERILKRCIFNPELRDESFKREQIRSHYRSIIHRLQVLDETIGEIEKLQDNSPAPNSNLLKNAI